MRATGRTPRRGEDGGDHPGGGRAPARRRASTPTSPAWRARTTSTRRATRSPRTASSTWRSAWARRSWTAGRLDLLARLPARAAAVQLGRRHAQADPDRVLGGEHGPAAGRTTRSRETEYLVQAGLADAEADGTLRPRRLDLRRRRPTALVLGMGERGPARRSTSRRSCGWTELPLNDAVRALLGLCAERAGRAGRDRVRASTFRPAARRAGAGAPRASCRCGRCWSSSRRSRSATTSSPARGPWSRSEHVLGNGIIEGMRDIVYVKPEVFEARHTPAIAARGGRDLNQALVEEGRPYLLIGFGRWGSSDPWLGIPVDWAPDRGRARHRRGDACRR